MPSEKETLEASSSSRLRRNALTRSAKKLHLASAYNIKGVDAEKILDEMYGSDQDDHPPVINK